MMKKDMKTVALQFAASAMVIIGLLFYILGYGGSFNLSGLMMIVTVVVLVVLATYIAIDKYKSAKVGLPIKDERERKIWHKAGYYAYLATIYIALGLSFISDDVGLAASQLAGGIILLSAIVFIGLYFYFRWKGSAE